MKLKYIKTALIGIILLQVTACTDILDKDPVSSFSASGFYKTAADAQAGVYGIYDAAQSVFYYNFCYWGEGRADNVQTAQTGESLTLLSNNLTNTASSADWSALYRMVSRANYAIRYIPDLFEEDNMTGKQLLGQAYALRALAYFYLARVWGDVPFITEPYTSGDQDIFIGKTDREIILDQVEEDLKYAAVNCVEKFNSNNDRIMFTRG
ncbi:MAG: RagB/SusD family nutrient uptake outer membrane protein, partial [Bacteroidales bacterium]